MFWRGLRSLLCHDRSLFYVRKKYDQLKLSFELRYGWFESEHMCVGGGELDSGTNMTGYEIVHGKIHNLTGMNK